MPRWKRHDGADFVFYDPHPGFTTGRAEMPVLDMWCNTFRHAMHIVAERSQRNVCQHYWAMAAKLLVVPYVPATSDVAKPLKACAAPWEVPNPTAWDFMALHIAIATIQACPS